MDKNTFKKIALVSEFPPPAAGMTILAEEFVSRFEKDGLFIERIRTNPQLKSFSWANKISVFKTILKWIIFLYDCRKIRNCDVLHIFSSSGLNFWLFTIAPMYMAGFLNKRIIIHYHGGGAESFFYNKSKLLRHVINHSHRLVVPSGFLFDVFNRLGYEAQIIPNFANVERFKFKQRTCFRPIVMSIRNLSSLYNVQGAVKAFSFLQREYPEAVLYIIGDGPEKQNICSLIENLQLMNIKLIGNIPNTQVPEYFDKADILINSSKVDNMPGSILEAFAAGVAVVSTNVGGIPYMVNNNETGLLNGVDEFDELGKSMLWLVKHPKEAALMTEKAYASLESLKWDKIKIQWLELYSQL